MSCLHEKPMMSTEAGTAEVLKCPYSPMVLPALYKCTPGWVNPTCLFLQEHNS